MSALALAVSWLALASYLGQESADAERFVIVVNAANPETIADAETLASVFLRQRKTWRRDETILPVDQSVRSMVRNAFTMAVFGQQAGTIQAYWEAEVRAGRDLPPSVRSSDEEVLAFVAANVGAIGYVSSAAKLSPKVKALRFKR